VHRPPLKTALLLALVASLLAALGSANAHGDQLTLYDGRVAHISGPTGDTFTPDENGLVPMYEKDSIRKMGYARMNSNGKAVIYFNERKMRASGATPCGWDSLLRHEKSHALGLSHGEGKPPDGDGVREKGENRAFYPTVPIHCDYPANPDNNFANKY